MFMNMFIMFDPIIMKLPINLILSMISILIFKKNFWNLKFLIKFNKFINNLIMSLNLINNKFMLNMMNSLFLIILIMNLMNLNPNFLAISNNIMFSFSLTMMFWMNLILYWKFNNIFFLNFSPKNTPLFMLYIINLIELNSLMFQIISLSMRLMINMIMGHIIISLINNLLMIFFYLMFEFMIIFIQTYIFFILNTLNLNNIN